MSDSDVVKFLLGGEEMLRYDKSTPLPDSQREYLNVMDEKMEQGFELIGERIVNPEQQQKSQFVAFNLVHALENNDDQTAIVMFSYLVHRMPNLKQVKVRSESGKIGIEFIFDQVKSKGQKINFMSRDPDSKLH
jgi:hypothetical protein